MSNTIYDKSFFEDMINKSEYEREIYLEKWCSITDLESIVCVLYYEITKCLHKNISNEYGKDTCEKEKNLIEDILNIRRRKLDEHFIWNDYYKKQLLELNEMLMNGFSIDIKLSPFILEPNENDYSLEERGKGIYYLLYNILSDRLLTDSLGVENDNIKDWHTIKYGGDGENFNRNEYIKQGHFDNSFICWGLYDLFSCGKELLSWYDILRINEILVEVNVTNQHFIENIGKGTFWGDGLQSLIDNEAENLRQEYMSRLSKDMTGLPVEILVDEMNCWEKIGHFKRIKFQGNKADKIDFRKMYSMSIEKEPRILVKDAQIDLSDEELQQVKNYVSKNRNSLVKMANGKISLLDFAESIGCFKRRNRNEA